MATILGRRRERATTILLAKPGHFENTRLVESIERRPLALQITEAVSLILCPAFIAVCIYLTAGRLWNSGAWWVVIVSGFLGWACADILTGLVHWVFDRYGRVDTPLLGRHFIGPFREHHTDPKAMTRHGFLETNGNSAILGVVVVGGILLWLLYGDSRATWLDGALMFLLSTGAWSLPANQVHKWAHQDRVAWPIAALQKSGLILKPHRHAVHHAPPHRIHYCIAHGNLNRLLDSIRFFAAIERVLFWFGAEPAENQRRSGDFVAERVPEPN